MKTPHTHYKRGTPLRVILRCGKHLYDHFEEHGSDHITLRRHGRLELKIVKAVTIWKGGIAQNA